MPALAHAQPAAAPAPAAAAATPAPLIAAAPEWVDAVPIPAADPKAGEAAVQSLLVSLQSRYPKSGAEEHFIEFATLIQTPQGLSGLGTIAFPWQPDQTELIVHKVHIIREGKVIDLLAGGQRFTVLRRESNLEAAMLDGVLTAMLQPEGLRVGDVVDVAWTMRRKAGAIPFRGENLVALGADAKTRRMFVREVWEDGVAIRWKATDSFGSPKVRKSRWGNELIADFNDAKGPKPPEGAPPRYAMPARLDITAYSDWSEISRMFAPAYAEAAKLPTGSALQAEIDKITASTPDPKKRAMAALRLVEDKVRYFLVGMGDGGHVPASADLTWSRRFGDCKGKTVTLLALLAGLGIEAEPLLVNSVLGDSLGERLPQVSAFDHVVVRAKIGGATYILDGTRTGDRSLDALASSRFRWGLPVTATGASLEALPVLPPQQPLNEINITYDASKGFEAAVPFTGTVLIRGDFAVALGAALAETPKADLKERFMGLAPNAPGAKEIATFDYVRDEEAQTVTISFTGKTQMDWPRAPGTSTPRFRFDDSTISWAADFKREDGPFKDAPFALPFPSYAASTETVILPLGGKGFTVEGKDLERRIAGVEMARKFTLEGGRAVARSTFRALQPEISAKEALAAVAAVDEVNSDRLWVRAPAGYKVSAEERTAVLSSEPVTADGYNVRGWRLMEAGRLKEAMADFDKAAEMEPRWATPLANRGLALIHLDKLDEAKTFLDRSASLDEANFVTWQGYALLHLQKDRPQESLDAVTRAIALDPDNAFTLSLRAFAYEQLGRLDDAASDLERLLRLEPDDQTALNRLAAHAARRGRETEALALADKVIAASPEDPMALRSKAMLLARFGKKDEAALSFAKALSMLDGRIAAAKADGDKRALVLLRVSLLADSGQAKAAVQEAGVQIRKMPASATLLNMRCWTRATSNIELEQALADCNEALEVDPENLPATDSRGFVKLRLGRYDEAIADFSDAVKWEPKQAASWYGLGIARLRKGEKEAGERDLATARRLNFDIDAEYKAYGVQP